jgi:hypothetical protein
MIQLGIPIQVGMAIKRHKNESYYITMIKLWNFKKMIAMRIITRPFHDGKHVLYEYVFHEPSTNDIVIGELVENNNAILLVVIIDVKSVGDL